MLVLEQARGRPTWSLRATWRPRTTSVTPGLKTIQEFSRTPEDIQGQQVVFQESRT